MKEFDKKAFVADVIKALEDAQHASQTPKSIASLARDAYSKLQFDFPLVTKAELDALIAAFRAQQSWAVLTDRLLAVLQDCISRGSSKSGLPASQQASISTAESSSSGQATTQAVVGEDAEADNLLASFQKLYCLSVLTTITAALSSPPRDAVRAKVLRGLTAPLPSQDLSAASGSAAFVEDSARFSLNVQHLNEAIEVVCEAEIAGDEEEDLEDYEPIDQTPAAMAACILENSKVGTSISVESPAMDELDIQNKVVYLSSRLGYHMASSNAVWQDGEVLAAVEQCLMALRNHPNFLQLLPVAEAVCGLVHDRIQNFPAALDSGMDTVVKGLHIAGNEPHAGGRNTAVDRAAMLLALGVAASLATRIPPGPHRRRFWNQARDVWLPAAAAELEKCEAQHAQRTRRAKTQAPEALAAAQEAEEMHSIAIAACITEFYVADAPPTTKAAQLQEVLLASGIFRGLILAFGHAGTLPGQESLRRAVLVCCSASPELLAWAHSVPGFAAAWEKPEFQTGGSCHRHAAVHAALAGHPAGDARLAEVLGGSEVSAGDVPSLHVTLVLLDAVQRASRGGPEKKWGPATDAALLAAASVLRSLPQQEKPKEHEDKDAVAHDEEKLGLSTEVHAVQLAARLAKMLQPECLRLIKGLRAKPGSVGKYD